MLINTIKLDILILVLVTSTFIQGYRNARKYKFLQELSHKALCTDLDGIWYVVETC